MQQIHVKPEEAWVFYLTHRSELAQCEVIVASDRGNGIEICLSVEDGAILVSVYHDDPDTPICQEEISDPDDMESTLDWYYCRLLGYGLPAYDDDIGYDDTPVSPHDPFPADDGPAGKSAEAVEEDTGSKKTVSAPVDCDALFEACHTAMAVTKDNRNDVEDIILDRQEELRCAVRDLLSVFLGESDFLLDEPGGDELMDDIEANIKKDLFDLYGLTIWDPEIRKIEGKEILVPYPEP